MKEMRFKISECPDNMSIWDYIRTKSQILKYYSMKPDCDSFDVMSLQHSFDIPKLIDIVKDMTTRFEQRGWNSSNGPDKYYRGLSLVYNPDYVEDVDRNYQTLGTARNANTQFFYGQMQNFATIRNSYFDSYAFRKPSPCVTETGFYDFIKGFKRHSIRSRIATVFSKNITPEAREKGGWHKDEVVFENLRINIPITTDETFLFEVVDKPKHHLAIGNVYSWDTNIPHRVVVTSDEDRSRTHIVLGFSPWFDYDEEDDAYVSNEFFGELHPFDMLLGGHVHPGITGLKPY